MSILIFPFRRVYYWCLILWLSARWIWRPNLGNRVVFRGERWTLIQGVSDPFWDLVRGAGADRQREDCVHRKDFRKIWTPAEMWFSFRSGYRFYMGYWYDIWVRKGVEPWVRGCRIWGK